MIAVREADRLLETFRLPFPSESVGLGQAAGRILREPIRADRAYPVLDKARMDGVAIAYQAWQDGLREFPVLGMARAGDPRQALPLAAGCMEVMTGAPCPLGCDTVIPYEDFEWVDSRAKILEGKTIRPAQFVHARGSDCVENQVLVGPGRRLQAPAIAAAASVGMTRIQVTRRPRIEVVATGDELVDVADDPALHQIRLSNSHGLQAMLEAEADLRIDWVGDARSGLAVLLARRLEETDVLLVTGGVSAGKFDFVPEVLSDLGVTLVFHRVAQRPGKPLWFGCGPGGQLVFGLPGNPVSALVCARRFLVPLLQAKSGLHPLHTVGEARLATEVRGWEAGTQFLPVRIVREEGGGYQAIPKPTNGSGDFAGLGESDGFVEVRPGSASLLAGQSVPYFSWGA